MLVIIETAIIIGYILGIRMIKSVIIIFTCTVGMVPLYQQAFAQEDKEPPVIVMDSKQQETIEQIDSENPDAGFGNLSLEGDLNPFGVGNTDSASAIKADSGIWSRFWAKTRFTYQHELGYQTTDPKRVEVNRSSLRLRWDSLFAEHYYIFFDGKARAHFSNDRKSRVQGEDDVLYEEYVQEFYLQASWGQTSVAVGRQKIVWGESDIAVITDIFSPRDIEDFIYTSLDQSRIGQTLLKLDRYSDAGQWTLIINPDPKTDTDLVIDGNQSGSTINLGDVEIREKELDATDTEYGLRWAKSIGKGDFSIMAADVASNHAIFFFEGTAGTTTILSKEYPRYQMFGGAMNLSMDAFALNVEAAYKNDFSFQVDGPYSLENNGVVEKDRFETAVSLQYTSPGDQVFLIGFSNQHTIDWEPNISGIERNTNDITFSWADKYLHDTLSLAYVYKFQFESENTIHNFTASYAMTDDLYISLDLYALATGDNIRFPYLDDNSLIFRVEYNF